MALVDDKRMLMYEEYGIDAKQRKCRECGNLKITKNGAFGCLVYLRNHVQTSTWNVNALACGAFGKNPLDVPKQQKPPPKPKESDQPIDGQMSMFDMLGD